jgi:hypothetical protein
MNTLELVRLDGPAVKVGQKCTAIEPNITEDTIFTEGGKPVGFYLRDIAQHSTIAGELAAIANRELCSDRVPKTEMSRGPQGNKLDKLRRLKEGKNLVTQYSAILGSVPPKPHMRRPYPTISSVHSCKTAKVFVKSMLYLCRESEALIKQLMPEQYEVQKAAIAANVPDKYRFGELFTSSISNYNIAADYHIDRANLRDCVNVIIAKREAATGENTNVPSYGATVDSCDNSMLVYPAWKDIHGVTPIVKQLPYGYRNTLVFYPLAAFAKYV